MKREEAIAILDLSKVCVGMSGRKYDEAVDMAISKLKTDIIWCRDCIHHFYDSQNDCWMCHKHEYGETYGDYDFCSWAERREP